MSEIFFLFAMAMGDDGKLFFGIVLWEVSAMRGASSHFSLLSYRNLFPKLSSLSSYPHHHHDHDQAPIREEGDEEESS
jgi:hypothetical protein